MRCVGGIVHPSIWNALRYTTSFRSSRVVQEIRNPVVSKVWLAVGGPSSRIETWMYSMERLGL